MSTVAHRSERLTPEEWKAFKKWVNQQRTKEVAADILEVHRNTLDRAYLLGSGSPLTIGKIRQTIAT